MARPTIYSQEMVEKARSYLASFSIPDREGFEVVPSIEGLSLALDISRDTVYDWRAQEEKQEFSDIVDQILATQALMLCSGGLTSTYNASIAKLMLTKHGYSDKQQQEITGSNGGPLETSLKVEFVDTDTEET